MKTYKGYSLLNLQAIKATLGGLSGGFLSKPREAAMVLIGKIIEDEFKPTTEKEVWAEYAAANGFSNEGASRGIWEAAIAFAASQIPKPVTVLPEGYTLEKSDYNPNYINVIGPTKEYTVIPSGKVLLFTFLDKLMQLDAQCKSSSL